MPSALNALKRLTLAFIIMAMVGALCPLPSFAIERQVIRLGYYDQPGLTEGMGDDQRKSGYAYDYLQRISDYTGWKYEYVYGELPELYEKMDQGEVDMIAGVSPNDKTASKAEFANQPIGKRNCTIYKAQDDDSIAPGFMASFIGKRIGVVEGSSSQTFLKKHLKKNVVSCKVVTFADQDAMVEALANDQIDALTAMDIDVSKVPGITECLTIAQDDFYVCVAPSKRTILRGLNEADAQLRNEDPHFLEQLYSRYYQKEAASVAQSDKEKAWLRVHDQLRIGYLEDYLPFSATDDKGQVTGLLKDYLETLQAQPELESLAMEAVPYTNLHDAYDALQSGEIHVLFPTYQDTWYAEGLDLRESTTVFSQTADLIFTGTYSDATLGTIAICAADTSMEGYAAQFFPNSELLMCDSWEACIDAVKGGRAGSALMNRYKSSQHLQQPGNQALRSTSLSTPCTLSFSVKSTDVELLSLINRGIRLMGTEAIDGAVSRYTYYNFDYSLSSFLAAHIELTILAVVLFVLLLVAAFLYYIRSSKKSQDQLNQAKDQLTEALAQADFANESKTKFLFNMSHDIRTPMNAILGFADLLEKHDDDPQKRHQYTDNIKTAGGYLLDLINEVLEMARIESGKANLNEEPGDYVDMLDAVEVVLSEVSGEKNQTLTKTVSIQHPHIFFDITKERTIFLNVIGNAIKYTPAGGTVEVTVTEQPGPDADTIILESVIKDNGIGMTKDFLPHIFDSFSRERTVTESKVTGTGLGMGIVKSYVELMGGTIDVESRVGVGTTITTRIPHRIARDFVKEQDVDAITTDALAGKHVLLAEDNELNQEIACEILRETGLTVDCASDGIECVSLLSAEPAGTFDFVLMDIQMLNMDGLKATETIRQLEDSRKANIPIIAMTANVFDTDKARAFEAGMDGFTCKPIQVSELMAELTKVLAKKRH